MYTICNVLLGGLASESEEHHPLRCAGGAVPCVPKGPAPTPSVASRSGMCSPGSMKGDALAHRATALYYRRYEDPISSLPLFLV